MRKPRKNYSPSEKVAMLKRHPIDKIPISQLCEEYQLQPTVFYNWQLSDLSASGPGFSVGTRARCFASFRARQFQSGQNSHNWLQDGSTEMSTRATRRCNSVWNGFQPKRFFVPTGAKLTFGDGVMPLSNRPLMAAGFVEGSGSLVGEATDAILNEKCDCFSAGYSVRRWQSKVLICGRRVIDYPSPLRPEDPQ